jgi:hypothetical protein
MDNASQSTKITAPARMEFLQGARTAKPVITWIRMGIASSQTLPAALVLTQFSISAPVAKLVTSRSADIAKQTPQNTAPITTQPQTPVLPVQVDMSFSGTAFASWKAAFTVKPILLKAYGSAGLALMGIMWTPTEFAGTLRTQ